MILGTLRFVPADFPKGLQRYGETKLRGVAPIMEASELRVFEDLRTPGHTPVDTGHMHSKLRKTSDLEPVGFEYELFWHDVDFLGQVNPRGQVILEFYPEKLILGDRHHAPKYPSLMTEEMEAERPKLVQNLTEHFRRPV